VGSEMCIRDSVKLSLPSGLDGSGGGYPREGCGGFVEEFGAGEGAGPDIKVMTDPKTR